MTAILVQFVFGITGIVAKDTEELLANLISTLSHLHRHYRHYSLIESKYNVSKQTSVMYTPI